MCMRLLQERMAQQKSHGGKSRTEKFKEESATLSSEMFEQQEAEKVVEGRFTAQRDEGAASCPDANWW